LTYPHLLPGIAKEVYVLQLGTLCGVSGSAWLQQNINMKVTREQNQEEPSLTQIF